MKFKGAVICEQGRTFAVVAAKKDVIDDKAAADRMIAEFAPVFEGLPVILVYQDSMGRAAYYGEPDLSEILTRVTVRAIPMREYAWDDE